jgi:hypothetical protein
LIKGGEVWEAKVLIFTENHQPNAEPKLTGHWGLRPVSVAEARATGRHGPVRPVQFWL